MTDDNIDESITADDALGTIVYEPEVQDEIPFRGRLMVAAKLADGQGYVSLNSVAAAFGIIPLAVGLGFFLDYTLIRRDLRTSG
jgi:hypothetical protein